MRTSNTESHAEGVGPPTCCTLQSVIRINAAVKVGGKSNINTGNSTNATTNLNTKMQTRIQTQHNSTHKSTHNSTQHNTTQHNTTQHNTTQHNTTQHNTTQHNTTQHNTTQHNRTQHNTTQHNTTQHNTTQHNTTQHNTTQRNTRIGKRYLLHYSMSPGVRRSGSGSICAPLDASAKDATPKAGNTRGLCRRWCAARSFVNPKSNLLPPYLDPTPLVSITIPPRALLVLRLIPARCCLYA